MPESGTTAQRRGRIGGLVNAALAPSPQKITEAARASRWEGYRDQVREACPHITDPAEIDRRAGLLRQADMTRMSLKASVARSTAARARRELAEAEAGLAEAGNGDAA